MNAAELPPLYQADLDDETYRALLRDLSQLDGGLLVSVKRSARGLVEDDTTWTLSAAESALDRGEVRAIQVRYQHEGQAWTDTVLRTPTGLRLVRMRDPILAEASHESS